MNFCRETSWSFIKTIYEVSATIRLLIFTNARVPFISPNILQCSNPQVISVRRSARCVKSRVCTCVFLFHATQFWRDCVSILERGYEMK